RTAGWSASSASATWSRPGWKSSRRSRSSCRPTSPVGEIAVAAAQRRDVLALARVLARAFYRDPVMAWMVPDDATRERALGRMFATMTRHHFLRSGAPEVAGGDRLGAAALWDPPGGWRQTPLQELRMMPGFLRAFGTQVRRGQQV